MGASIAYHLGARGVGNVVLLERASICSGPTRHSTAIIRLHYTQPLLVQMAAHGLRTYVDFERVAGGPSGFVRTGMLFAVAASERGMLEANVALGQKHGVSTQLLDAEQLADLDPRVVGDDLVFCFEPEAGYCDPYTVTSGFAAAASRAGVRIEEGVEVRHIRTGLVETSSTAISAGTVVVAAGPWTPRLLEPLGYELPIRPARAEVGRFRLPHGFGSPPPAVADFSKAQFYFCPAEPGYLQVGSLDPRHADRAVDPDGCPEGAERETLRAYQDALAARLRGAERGHWRGAWSGIYDVTPDWEPVIGPVPGAPDVFVAAGFSGHGFKLAPAVGLTIAELVCDGRASAFDLGLLDPLRFEQGRLVGAAYGYSVLG